MKDIRSIINSWVAMDVENPGNEECEIFEFIESGGTVEEIFETLKLVLKDMSYNEREQYYAAMEVLLETK